MGGESGNETNIDLLLVYSALSSPNVSLIGHHVFFLTAIRIYEAWRLTTRKIFL